MNEAVKIEDCPEDIDALWAGDGSHLPEWFVSALRVPREEGYVEIEGAKAHYFRWGDRAKPKVLMTHGFLSHARCFSFIAPFLAEDYDVVAFDLAGMGDSEMRGHADPLARGREFGEIAEALGLFADGHKPTIIAHSFGSGAALTAVTQSPDTFSGIVVCDLMVMRPALLQAYWNLRRASPGSATRTKPKVAIPATTRRAVDTSFPHPSLSVSHFFWTIWPFILCGVTGRVGRGNSLPKCSGGATGPTSGSPSASA